MKKLLLFLLLAIPAYGTSVSGAVQDASGQIWFNGTWSVKLVGQGPFFIHGTQTPVPGQTQSGNLDASGTFTGITLTPNSNIDPAGSQWVFSVCPAATYQCFTQAEDIFGVNQSLTFTPPGIRIDLTNFSYRATAYSDAEVVNGLLGNVYYNVTRQHLRLCITLPCGWVDVGGLSIVNGVITGGSLCAGDTDILFNDGGNFGCDANLTWNKSTRLFAANGFNVNTNGKVSLYAGAAPVDDDILLGNGTTFEEVAVPDCQDSGGNHLNYVAGSNSVTCGTSTSGVGPHNILSATHLDTTAASVQQGDVIIGHGASPTWSRLGIGSAGEVLTVVAGEPSWQPSGGGGTCADITQATDWYVDPSGSDLTGDGSNGTPWKTIQHAIDQLPGVVCGRYIIHLKNPITTLTFTDVAAGADAVYTYSGFTGPAPYIGMVVEVTGFTNPNNNVVGTLTNVSGGGAGTVTMALTTQANETHAGSGEGGHYIGQVNLAGRVFAGGNGGNTNTDSIAQWPIQDGGFPPAYSWVTIVGDDTDTAPSTFIIDRTGDGTVSGAGDGAVVVSGANLTLLGLTVEHAGYGIHAGMGAFVNLNGVYLTNNYTGILGTEQSVIHVEGTYFVDPDFIYSVKISNTDVGGSPFVGVDAVELTDGALLTDFQSDGNNTDTNAALGYVKGTGDLSLACLELKFGRVYFRGTIYCDTAQSSSKYGVVARDSVLDIATLTANGNSVANTKAISLQASRLSAGALGFSANYTFENAAVGVQMDSDSLIDQPGGPTLSGNTADWQFLGLSSSTPFTDGNVNGRAGEFLETVGFTATPAFDMRKGAVKKITLTGDVTSSSITNPPTTVGIAEFLTLIICQDGSGNHTFAWPATVASHGTIAATASKCNVQRFIYDVAATKWWSLSAMETGQ